MGSNPTYEINNDTRRCSKFQDSSNNILVQSTLKKAIVSKKGKELLFDEKLYKKSTVFVLCKNQLYSIQKFTMNFKGFLHITNPNWLNFVTHSGRTPKNNGDKKCRLHKAAPR